MPEFGEDQQFPKRTAPYNRRMGDDPFSDVKVSCTGEAADFLANKLSSVQFEYDGAGKMQIKTSFYAGAVSLINENQYELVTCTANPDEIQGEANLTYEAGNLGHPSFIPGFQGQKWRIKDVGDAEFEKLFIRGSLTVNELILNRLHYQCGGLIIGAGGGKIQSVSGAAGLEKIFFEDPEGNNMIPFTKGAIVMIQDFDLDRTTVVKKVVREVDALTDIGGKWRVDMTVTAGWGTVDDDGAFAAGDEVVAIGHVSDANLNASIYFSAVDANNPFMRVFDGVDSWLKWSLSEDLGKACIKYQSGNLASLANYGIVPANPGFGVYSTNVYLTGHIIISNPEDINSSTITNDSGWTDDTAANAAQATADGKIVTFYQDNPPSGQGEAIGDLWVDTNDNNNLWRYNGAVWVDIQDGDLVIAMADVITAQDTADGKIVTFYADNPPVAEGVGDLWIDTNDGNKLYRWSGSAWTEVQDQDIVQAIADALAAQTDATAALGLIPNDASGLIDFIVAPAGAGLYIGSTHLGYYDGSNWKTYMANNGDFFLGGTSGYLTWVAATNTLTVSGTINSTDGNIGGWAITPESLKGGTAATTIKLTPGTGIHMGNSVFAAAPFSVTNTGVLKAESGTIGGFTITHTLLKGGSGATTVALVPGTGIYMGNAVFASAPFSVTNAGVLKAISGNIGGWAIKSTSIHTGSEHLGDNYSTTGITLVSDGSIHTPYFYINTGGEIGISRVEEMLFKPDASFYGIKISGADIWENSYNAENVPVRINRIGYNGGTTRYRKLQVFDGKGSLVADMNTNIVDIFTTLRARKAFQVIPTIVTGAPKTISNDEYMIICNNVAGMTIYLPASPEGGQIHIIKRGAAGTVTLDGNGKNMFFNVNLASHGMSSGKSLMLVYDSTYGKWAVIGGWEL